LNWGCKDDWEFITEDNKVGHQRVVNKLDFFEVIDIHNKYMPQTAVNIPEWTTDPMVACDWNRDFFVRKTLTGHSGAGIVDCPAGTHYLYEAPLFVMYKKKKHEYRVHVFNNEVIDVTQKKKRKGFENVNTKIRNHQNGWVYCREDITEPHDLRTQAINAMRACALKFGAVDVIWNELENKCYVLEINTAPGLVGTTLDKYITAILGDLK